MVRDFRKDKAYFDKYLSVEESRFNEFYLIALEKSKENNNKAARKALTYAASFLRNKMIALYSSGAPLDDIKIVFEKWVDICAELPKLPYSDMILMTSLAILFEPKNKVLTVIKQLLLDFSEKDMLLEGFENYLFKNTFIFESASINYSNYSKLKPIIEEANADLQTDLLVQYIDCEWYSAQSDSAWYDSHIRDSDTYFGYWCFECAALAVALSLDLSKLRVVKYFPSDLL